MELIIVMCVSPGLPTLHFVLKYLRTDYWMHDRHVEDSGDAHSGGSILPTNRSVVYESNRSTATQLELEPPTYIPPVNLRLQTIEVSLISGTLRYSCHLREGRNMSVMTFR